MVLDPLTAIGLAANIVQFLGFAGGIVTSSAQLYRSADGTLSEDADLTTVTSDLVELNNRLKWSLRRGNDLSAVGEADKPLEDLISGCVAVAQELLNLLDRLKVKGSRYRTWKAIRKGVRSVLKRSEIESLQSRLALYRHELEFNLLVSMREQMSLESLQQSERFEALDQSAQLIARAIFTRQDILEVLLRTQTDDLKELHSRSDTLNVHEHERTRSELKEFIVQHNGTVATEQIEFQPVYESEWGHTWHSIRVLDQRKMRTVRDSLAYQELYARQSEIPEAHENTFEWIYKGPTDETRPWNSFINFLKGDDRLYWVHGKPGAGKSTLLKFLKKNPRTEEALLDWAGGKFHLRRCSFFFWNSGLQIQRSEEAFLRALLWTVLTTCETLIPFVLKEETTDANLRMIEKGTFTWTIESLRRARDRLINQTEYRLFLLIDGLDEFEGDHSAMAKWLLDATRSPSIKIVVSSRPWNAFREAFSEVPQLRLQDLTERDIKTYVEGHLMVHDKMKDLIKKEPRKATKLISDIVDKAEGVFLWVRVVVFSFLEGLRNRDKISELQARLLALPSDLESLYEQLLQRTDTFYGGIQSKYILMRLASKSPPPTLVFSLADDDNFETSLTTDAIERMPRGEALDRCEEMERRLQAACAGLLEVDYREATFLTDAERYKRLEIVDLFQTAYGSRIQFIHRTARDFFERSDVLAKLESSRKQKSFEPNLFMARGWALALIKLPTGGSGYEVNTMWDHSKAFLEKIKDSGLKSETANILKVLRDVSRLCYESEVRWIVAKYRLRSIVPSSVIPDDASEVDDTDSLAIECAPEAHTDKIASVADEQASLAAQGNDVEKTEKQKRRRSKLTKNPRISTHAGEKSARKRPTKVLQRLLCCNDEDGD